MRITLFGAKGMLGQDIVNHAEGHEVTAYSDVDIAQYSLVEEALEKAQPDVVINAAAYNKVDQAETDFATAMAVNGEGPGNLARASKKRGALLVHLSTDYVFSGDKETLYNENDAPDPLSRYGESKAAGETEIAAWNRHYILRTSALYGKGRDNHARRVIQATKGGPPTKAATDVYCSPTYSADLAKWIFQLLEKEPPFGVYHVVHKGVCTRYQFAARLCDYLRFRRPYPIEAVKIDSLGLPAKRPLTVKLSVKKWETEVGQLLTWEEGLKNYLRAEGFEVPMEADPRLTASS